MDITQARLSPQPVQSLCCSTHSMVGSASDARPHCRMEASLVLPTMHDLHRVPGHVGNACLVLDCHGHDDHGFSSFVIHRACKIEPYAALAGMD